MTQRPVSARLLPTALALFLIAIALRPQVVAIGPLLPAMRADLAISHALGGLVAAIPVMCMGIFALLGPWLGRRLGTERAIAVSVGAIVLFGLLRSLAPEPLSLVVLTFGVGVGIGVVGPLLPQVVQKRASRRAVIATGIYAGGIVTGATLSSALAVPLAGPELNWRVPLAIFSLASLGGLAAWLWLERPGPPTSEPHFGPPRLPWRQGRAWLLALLFGAQSILFYAANSWLPTIYVERGWPETEAGLLVGLMNGVSLVGTFAGPALADRLGSRRGSLAFWASGPLVGFLGVLLLPQLTLLWVVCMGIGLGAIFPLVLTLPVDFAGRAGQGAGGLAAIMLFGGYVLAAAGPLVFGLLRDATGAFTAGLWLMVAVAVAKMALSWWLVPADLASRSSRP